jgi:hypothetical protein
MMVCVYYIRKHMKNGDIVFEEAEKVTWAQTCSEMKKTDGLFKKLSVVKAFFDAKRNRGEWVEESKPAKFWSFLLKDLHGNSWKFFVW